jgi:hypothetical protein
MSEELHKRHDIPIVCLGLCGIIPRKVHADEATKDQSFVAGNI